MNKNNLLKQLFEKFENDFGCRYEAKIIEVTEEICRILKEKDMNNSDFAIILETNKATVNRMLNGNVKFTLMRLLKIADALDCYLDIKFSKSKKEK